MYSSSSGNSTIWFGAGDGGISIMGPWTKLLNPFDGAIMGPPPIKITGGIDKTGRYSIPVEEFDGGCDGDEIFAVDCVSWVS